MWIIALGLSIVFLGLNIYFTVKKSDKAEIAAILSLICMGIVFLDMYKNDYTWVKAEDWGALMDVVPGMYLNFYKKYIPFMSISNVVLLVFRKVRK